MDMKGTGCRHTLPEYVVSFVWHNTAVLHNLVQGLHHDWSSVLEFTYTLLSQESLHAVAVLHAALRGFCSEC